MQIARILKVLVIMRMICGDDGWFEDEDDLWSGWMV